MTDHDKAVRAAALEEAARCFADDNWPLRETVQATLLALASMPPGYVAVPVCHICGSVDAVRTEGEVFCSRGHGTVLPPGYVAVKRETLAQVRRAINSALMAQEDHETYPGSPEEADVRTAFAALAEVLK